MSGLAGNIRRFLSGSLLFIFIGYFATVTLFLHTHTINGVRITHSHPYSQAPDTGSHTHTSAEFTLIAHLSILVAVASSLMFFCGILPFKSIRLRTRRTVPVCGRDTTALFLRGPPACLAFI